MHRSSVPAADAGTVTTPRPSARPDGWSTAAVDQVDPLAAFDVATGQKARRLIPRTLFEKVWDAHVVRPETADTPAVLYVDLHLVHEVTSPQAFSELRARGLQVRRPDLTVATMDHSTPTLPKVDGRYPFVDRRGRGAGGGPGEELPRVRHHPARPGQRGPGHRPRDRPRARHHPARQDHRLRRQPHQHPRRLRSPGLRHRHERGGARPGHPVPPAVEGQDPGRGGRAAGCSPASRPRT